MNRAAPAVPRPGRRGGFTLPEVMISSTIALLVVGALMTGFIFQRKSLKVQQQVNEMQQNVRAAVDMVARDIWMAGYGLDVGSQVGSWITWVSGFTANPLVTQGSGSAPDTITIAAAFDQPAATLAAPSAAGATTVTVGSGQAGQFNTTNRRVIYLGKSETARVVSISGDTLTVSTHATQSKGLRYAYEAGAPVELVKAIRYSWSSGGSQYPYAPHLRREDLAETYSYDWQKFTAGNITDFQIAADAGGCVLTVTGRTSQRDPAYTDPTFNDRYRRLTLTRRVYPRN